MESSEWRAFQAGLNLGVVSTLASIDVQEIVAIAQEQPHLVRALGHEVTGDTLCVAAKSMRAAYEHARSGQDDVPSAEIVAEFVRGRPELELEIRRVTARTPEMAPVLVKELIVAASMEITDDERAVLARIYERGNGAPPSWVDVAMAFGAELRDSSS